MEIVDKDFRNGFICAFQYAVKAVSYFLHVSFLETCKSYDLCPSGLNIRKKPFIEFESDDLKVFWQETLAKTERDLLEALCVGICERMFTLESKFWNELRDLEEKHGREEFKEWLVKLMVHLEKKVKKVGKTKQRKLGKLANDVTLKEHVSERLKEHLSLFTFYNEFVKFCEEFCPDVVNLANLVTLGPVCNITNDISKPFEESHDDTFKDSPNENEPNTKEVTNAATLLDGRYQGKFVSPNVANLSSRILNKAEVSLLSKGLQFVPTPKNINLSKIKEEFEIFGRKLRLEWYFRNDERDLITNPFKKKSKFNPKNSNSKYSNLTKEERNAIYSLRDDNTIIIKEADKGSGIVVWYRKDYLAEAKKQLDDKEVYQEVRGDIESPLIKIIKRVLGNIRNRRDISDETTF